MAGPAARRTPAVSPWTRTRLRLAPGAALALFLLVLLTSFLAAAFPRALDRAEDRALRQSVAQEPPSGTTLQVTATDNGLDLTPDERAAHVSQRFTSTAYRKVAASLRAPLTADPDQSSYGARTTDSLPASDSWLPRPDGLPAQFTLTAQGGLADHAKVTSGRLPRAAFSAARAEAAATEETARRLHVEAGSVIHLPRLAGGRTAVTITGILAPRTPSGAYWSTTPLLRSAQLTDTKGTPPEHYWKGALLLNPQAGAVLLGLSGEVEQYWQLAPVTTSLTARDLPAFTASLTDVTDGPGLLTVRGITSPQADVSSKLGDVVSRYRQLRSGIVPVVSVAAYGTGTVACVVLFMAGGLAADRRRTELALLRARGGSLPGIGGRLLAESAVVAVPAGALGLLLAGLAVRGGGLGLAAVAAGAVVVVACTALPLRAVAAHRRARLHEARSDLAGARPSARRTVLELTVLVLAVGAIVALRRRGATDGGDGLVALAPVLVGVVAAFLLVRIHPLPLRLLVGAGERLRGVVGHLSLARAARTTASAGSTVLPLLALLTALTSAAFGGSVLAGIDTTRDRAATLATGADARVDHEGALAASAVSRIRAVPGVRSATGATIRYDAKVADGTRQLPLAGVDPDAYARLARSTGLGAFPAKDLKPSGATVPALVSPSMTELFSGGRLALWMNGESVTLRLAAVRPTTPALVDDFLIVDSAALARATEVPSRTTTLLLTGDVDGRALRAAAGSATTVRVRAEERAGYADSALQSGATDIYVAAVAAGAGFAVLALLLSLARATPERLALLARLRTMGLTRRQGRRLLVLEALPQALLAAVGGALTGWATVRVLAPGLDLTSLALAADAAAGTTSVLRTDPASIVLPAAAVLLLALAVAALQAYWAGRRGSVKELRAGEQS